MVKKHLTSTRRLWYKVYVFFVVRCWTFAGDLNPRPFFWQRCIVYV
jgi:hypothetical protein